METWAKAVKGSVKVGDTIKIMLLEIVGKVPTFLQGAVIEVTDLGGFSLQLDWDIIGVLPSDVMLKYGLVRGKSLPDVHESIYEFNEFEVLVQVPEIQPQVAPKQPVPRSERELAMALVNLRRKQELECEIHRARNEGRTLDVFCMTEELGNFLA